MSSGSTVSTGWYARAELPTWLVAIACYGGFGLLIMGAGSMPLWAVLSLGAWFVAWHGSLQHEAVHGHPTRIRWLNDLLVSPPLGLAIPFEVYRESHLAHHSCGDLTRPGVDPESFYLDPSEWQHLSPPTRGVLWFNNTLIGRLTIGPGILIARSWRDEMRRIFAGDRRSFAIWLRHCLAVAALMGLVWAVAGPSGCLALALFAYPGLSLVLLRSFLEHRPAAASRDRTATVDAALPFRLLYLNNNFHALHHARPDLPWFALPRLHARSAGCQGGYGFAGYGEIARRYLMVPKDSPVFPAVDAARDAQGMSRSPHRKQVARQRTDGNKIEKETNRARV